MKILILGGTIFVGRHFVQTALERGHEVSIFNRGSQQENLFSAVEYLVGDRHSNLSALKNKQWDAVIDTSGYIPKAVQASADILRHEVDQYVYISTTSVYQSHDADTVTGSPLQQIADGDLAKAENTNVDDSPTAMTYGGSYGALKAECEKAVTKIFEDKALIIRPGVIAGPYDYTNRIVYWLKKLEGEGNCIAPVNPNTPVRFIDGRDLASWVLDLIERKVSDTFNVMGEEGRTFGEFLQACTNVTNSSANLVWVNEEALLNAGVSPWLDLPLWLDKKQQDFLMLSDNKSISNGLIYRTIENTVSDTYAWFNNCKPTFKIETGLPLDKEASIINNVLAG